jgi:hypothetical protein
MPGNFKAQVVTGRIEQLEIFLAAHHLDVVSLYHLPSAFESILDKGKEGNCHVAVLGWTYLLRWVYSALDSF